MRTCPFCAEKVQDQAVVCKHCKKELPKPSILLKCFKCGCTDHPAASTTCSSCGSYLPAYFIGAAMGLGIVFSVFLFIVLATREGEPTKTTPKPPVQAAPARDPEYGRGIEVQSCAQLYVEGLLKSPRSAKHPWVLASDVVTKISEGQYRIRNYVDAENAYGAMLRQYYTCDVTLSGDRCSNVVCEFD